MPNVNTFLQNHIWLPLALLVGLMAAAIFMLARVLKTQKTQQQARQALENALYDLSRRTDALQQNQQHAHQALTLLPRRDEINQSRDNQSNLLLARMEALGERIDRAGENQEQRIHRMSALVDEKLSQNESRMTAMQESLRKSVRDMQEDNGKRLEDMRKTVDEKLHETLDRRLNESFSAVSKRLEEVHKGLGEMQTLASGVGDLKKVLTNVKNRGVWGEMQLGALLEQVLTPNQYDVNVQVIPRSSQRVEYAVRLPGQQDETVYLPIDAKFPVEDYARLMDALDEGDQDRIALCTQALQNAIRTEAKRIFQKYVQPPYTTDFAIMFLPLEGLYAEVLRCPGLAEEMQEKFRIVIAGPTTLSALLTSLQVGFRTLAIEKRSGEVWQLLSAVKTEFGKFTDLLEKAHKQVHTVSASLENASRKSRTITGKLKQVEMLDEHTAARLLASDDVTDAEEDAE